MMVDSFDEHRVGIDVRTTPEYADKAIADAPQVHKRVVEIAISTDTDVGMA